MAANPLGLSLDIEMDEHIEELSKAPLVSLNGTVYAGKVMISTTSCTLGGRTMTLDPQELEGMDGSSLGRGSSGSVRRVRHTITGQELAVKEIKISNEAHLNEIQKELETLHQGVASQHKNLIDFYGAYAQEGCVYIAMECMDGSLNDLAKIPENILAKMTKQVLQGLHYLHASRHLIHRDIKPSNLLYRKDGTVKITDFGVAGQLDNSHACAVSFVGTVTYMSPERLKGDAHGSAGDIWSLGISLLEMAIGVHPYKNVIQESGNRGSEGKFWSLLSHLSSSDTSVDLPDSSTSAFKSFVEACTVKDPATRASSTELLAHEWLSANCEDDKTDLKAIAAWIKDYGTVRPAPGYGQGVSEQSKATMAQAAGEKKDIGLTLDALVDV